MCQTCVCAYVRIQVPVKLVQHEAPDNGHVTLIKSAPVRDCANEQGVGNNTLPASKNVSANYKSADVYTLA